MDTASVTPEHRQVRGPPQVDAPGRAARASLARCLWGPSVKEYASAPWRRAFSHRLQAGSNGVKTSIAVLSFNQETDSFSPVRTGLEALRHGGLLAGDEVAARFRGTDTEIGGFLDVIEDEAETAFLPSISLMPAGPMTDAALDHYGQTLQRAFRELPRPPDAVLIALHGALAATSEPDATGWLLERLRTWVGPAPIVASVDLHANVTRRMLANADVLVGYRTYPHADLRETGRRAAHVLQRVLSTGRRPKAVSCRLPLIVPPDASEHTAFPMSRVWQDLRAVEAETGWPASCFCTHPWLDAPEFSVLFLAYDDTGGIEATRNALAAAARALWDAKEHLYRPMPDLDAAWRQAESCTRRPVILVDSGDVVLAGAPGDSTAILHFLAHSDTALRCLLHVTDPAAVARLAEARPGQEMALSMGATWSHAFCEPIEIRCALVALSDEAYVASGSYQRGVRVDAGARAVVQWGQHTLVVAGKPDPAHDPQFFRSLGIDPAQHDVIVVKSHNTFRPAYQDISTTVIRAATPGATSPDLFSLPYSQGPQRLYPLAPAVASGSGASGDEARDP